MFLGFLPSWIGDLLTIILAALGLPSIILFLLGRRNANRHLNVEEGSLKVDEFDAIKGGYKDLWDASKKDAASAKADADAARADAATARLEATEAKKSAQGAEASVRKLYTLITTIVKKNDLTLSADDLAILEQTRPRDLRRR